jgi:hypothetical protein
MRDDLERDDDVGDELDEAVAAGAWADAAEADEPDPEYATDDAVESLREAEAEEADLACLERLEAAAPGLFRLLEEPEDQTPPSLADLVAMPDELGDADDDAAAAVPENRPGRGRHNRVRKTG